ncbi:Uncharacterised protein [Mycobacterium tuberculosis]|nr:Uncharacterised protein [Mycobacterium tuberculosis]
MKVLTRSHEQVAEQRFDNGNEIGKIEKLPCGPGCDGWVVGASDP